MTYVAKKKALCRTWEGNIDIVRSLRSSALLSLGPKKTFVFDGTRAPSNGHKGFSIVLKSCQFPFLFIYLQNSAFFNDFWPKKRQKFAEALFMLVFREFFFAVEKIEI